jgi:hypothetical protein
VAIHYRFNYLLPTIWTHEMKTDILILKYPFPFIFSVYSSRSLIKAFFLPLVFGFISKNWWLIYPFLDGIDYLTSVIFSCIILETIFTDLSRGGGEQL